MFVFAVAAYVILRLLSYVMNVLRVYPEWVRLVANLPLAVAYGYVFAFTTARLVRDLGSLRVIKAGLVAGASVFTAGMVIVGLATHGMPRLLIWDHPQVVREAAFKDAEIGAACAAFALVIAGIVRLHLISRAPSTVRPTKPLI